MTGYQRVYFTALPGSGPHERTVIGLALPEGWDLKKIDYKKMCYIADTVKEVLQVDEAIIFFPKDIYDDFMYDKEHIGEYSFPKSRLIQFWQQDRIKWGDNMAVEAYSFCAGYFSDESDDVIHIIGVVDNG